MDDLQIRHSEAGDIGQIRAIYSDPSSYAATLQLPFPSQSEWERKLGELPPGTFSLVACRDAEVMGQLSLSIASGLRRRHAASLGMGVRPSARRTGVGSALMAAAIDLAERWAGVRRLELEVYTDNQPAIGLYRKFGFAIEGTLRQYALRDGRLVDVHLMSRLAAAP